MKCLFFAGLIVSHSLWGQQAQQTPEAIPRVVEEFMRAKQVPGVAAAVYVEGQSFLVNFGYAHPARGIRVDSDTLFEIASITKVFTSEAVAVAMLQGKMQLNAPITTYLPQLRKNPYLSGVSIQALATHSASLPRVPPGGGYNPQRLMRYFAEQWRPQWPIGSRYLYSNVGFGLLGYALAEREGIPFYQVLEWSILQPLGMNSTWIVVPPAMHGNYAQGFASNGQPTPESPLNAWPGGGALRSTGRDMLKFLLANLGIQGPPDLLRAMQVAQQGLYQANPHLTLGMGWQRFQGEHLLFIDKNGGVDGFSSYIGMLPDKGVGVVLLANRGKTDITETGRRLLRELVKKGGGT